MQISSERLAWYAIQVALLKEKQVASVLSEKGYECFLPLYSKRTTWSDRIKVASVPLFRGYVFSRFDVQTRLPILVTPNVHSIVGHGKVPIAIPDQEIEAIRAVIQSRLPIEPCDRLQSGDTVRITKGPLAGVEGAFVRYHGGCRLVLSIALIKSAVSVEIDRTQIEPVLSRRGSEQLAAAQ
jgi:transcription antitermination factor NusG